MKRTLFSRLLMALAVVVAMSLSTPRPAQACAGYPYAASGINCGTVFTGLGQLPLDATTQLALTMYYYYFNFFSYFALNPWTAPTGSPAATEPTAPPAGTTTPPKKTSQGSTALGGYSFLYFMGIPPEEILKYKQEGEMKKIDLPAGLDTGGGEPIDSVIPELQGIVVIAGKDGPDDRLLASFGPRAPAGD